MIEEKIDGKTYRVRAPLATKALLLKLKLLNVLGEGVKSLPSLLQESSNTESTAGTAVLNAIADIFCAAEPEKILGLMEEIIGIAEVQRPSSSWEKVKIDRDCADNIMLVYKLIFLVLKETYGPFFSEAMGNGTLKSLQEKL